jgi:hypothetical protein
MTERPSPGEQLAGIAGLALILIMFLFAWYSWPGAAGEALNGLDAFDAYGDWLNLILVAAAFSGICLALFGGGSERVPLSLAVLTAVLGGIGAILVIVFIISTPGPPDFGGGLVEGDLGVEPGAWLGLVALIALTVGGYKTMQEEGTSFSDAADRLSNRGGSPPPPRQQGYGEQQPQHHEYPPAPQQAPPPPPPEQPPPPPPPGYQPPPPPPPAG